MDSWEFAPSFATNLLGLTTASLPTYFYGPNDTNLQKVFGLRSTTNALHVEEGQVLFARHAEKPSCVFALQLVKGGRQSIERALLCLPRSIQSKSSDVAAVLLDYSL